MSTKHTPGPWTIDLTGPFTLGGDSREVVALDAEGMVTRGICSLMFDTDSFPKGRAFLEDKANAQLIAAAPDLLEACKAALLDLENRANYDESNRLPKLHGQENFWMRSHIDGTRAVASRLRAAIARAEKGEL